MCGLDYLQRTSASRLSALEMMREVSLQLNPAFGEWNGSTNLTDSLSQLLDNATLDSNEITTEGPPKSVSDEDKRESNLCTISSNLVSQEDLDLCVSLVAPLQNE